MNCDNQCCENHGHEHCHDHHELAGDWYGINVTALAHHPEPLTLEDATELVPEEMRRPGTKITFWTFDGWQTWQFQPMDVREWVLPESWEQDTYLINDLQNQIDSIQIGGWAISQEFGDDEHIGISQNALTEKFNRVASLDLNGKVYLDQLPIGPDEEDVTVTDDVLKFKDKAYNASSFSGLGKKILRKNVVSGANILTQEMVSSSNTAYIIQYDFDLDGGSIVIPVNSVLEFEGGSLNDGTLVGNMTQIDADKKAIFSGMTISGTWNVPEITSAWFADATTEDNVIKEIFKLTNDDVHNVVTIEDGTYTGGNPATQTGVVTLGSNTEVNLIGKIKQLPNSWNYGFVVDIAEGAENVYIHGSGTLEGDKLEHTGSTGEAGHGINMHESYNIVIEGITIKDVWGDCVYIGYTTTPATDIVLRNLVLDGGSRQGVSITSAKNVIIENCTIKNVSRTAPQAGIDIEPNADSVVDNITIKNCNILNCSGTGIQLFNKNIDSINDVLIQNVVIDGCSKGIGSTKVNITGLTIDSVIVRNHTSRGLWLIPYESEESEVDLSNIRNVNITNVYVDNQSAGSGNNVYVWVHNGFIQGCTFKDASLLRAYNFADTDHPQHALNILSTFLLAGSRTVNFHTGCVISQTSIECGVLRLPNGHTQFTGCEIKCGAIAADAEESAGSATNSFKDCNIDCTRNIILSARASISQSTVNATQISVGNYSSITGNYIYSRLRNNGSYTTINNNSISVGTSKLSEQYAVYSGSSNDYCTVSNNNIVIQDDDTEVETINGAVSIQGWGSIVSNNKITLQGSRSYSRYGIYIPSSSDNNVKVENNSFVYSYPFLTGMFPNTPTPIPYADNSKIKIGSTANRPTLVSCNKTFQYFDTTLGKPVWWTGSAWVDATGATV